MIAHNRLKTAKALLKMRSTIKIQKTPHSGPGQSITVTRYSRVLQNITWSRVIYIWVKIYLTMISWPLIMIRIFVVAWFGEQEFGFWNCYIWSKIKGYRFLWLLWNKFCSKMPQMNIFDICKKSKVPWYFNIQHNKILELS